MPQVYTFETLVWPITLLVGSIAIGILLELFLMYRLRRILAKNNWLSGGKILRAFKGITFIIFLGIGVYLCVNNLSLSPKLEKYLTKSLNIALILSGTILVARIAIAIVNSEQDKDRDDFQGTSIINNLIKITVYCTGFIVMLQDIGISVAPILTALGVGGLAVALALQDTLSNLFAGIFVIASKKVGIGDFIKLQSGEEGFVEDISWRTITIRETTDTTVVVPNSKLSTAIFKNYDLPVKEIIFPVQLMVSFDNDMQQVETIAYTTAKKIILNQPECVKTHEPVVRFHTFTDAGLQLFVTFRINSAIDQGPVRHAFIKEILTAFRTNGVEVSEKAFTMRNK